MSRRTGALALIAAAWIVWGCGSVEARPTSAYRPASGPWHPVAVAEATPAPSAAPGPFWEPMPTPIAESPTPSPAARPTPKPTPKPTRRPASPPPKQPSIGAHQLAGLASYYCRPGVSVCPVGFSPYGMYAAACAPLRAAMGPNWRGRAVEVEGIRIVLVDFCASTGKTIDLFWGVMHRLGGTGVLSVVVRW